MFAAQLRLPSNHWRYGAVAPTGGSSASVNAAGHGMNGSVCQPPRPPCETTVYQLAGEGRPSSTKGELRDDPGVRWRGEHFVHSGTFAVPIARFGLTHADEAQT
jgi:hypothetical protein